MLKSRMLTRGAGAMADGAECLAHVGGADRLGNGWLTCRDRYPPPQVKPCDSGRRTSCRYPLKRVLGPSAAHSLQIEWGGGSLIQPGKFRSLPGITYPTFRKKKKSLIDKDGLNIKLLLSNPLKASEMGRCRLAWLAVLVTSISPLINLL